MLQCHLIDERRRGIANEIREAKERIAALQAEDRELELALRVLARLHGVEPPPKRTEPQLLWSNRTVASGSKPGGTPTIPQMIVESLTAAKESRGRVGLEPKEITEYVAKRWWPDVTINNVGPVAWRMWRRGELIKQDSVYSLPKDKEPDGDALGSLKSDDGGGAPSSTESREDSYKPRRLNFLHPQAQPGE